MGLWASSKWALALGGYDIHGSVIHRIFGHSWKARLFIDAGVFMDGSRGGWRDSYLHAMHGKYELLSTSISKANHHVRTGFWSARTYINRGDGRNAYKTLGWVLHTMQDSTSPAHQYFQSWDGSPVGSWTWYKHVRREMYFWQVRTSVYSVSRWVWHMFYYRLVPTNSNVFIF